MASLTVLDVAKPDKFYGENVCCWLQSLDDYFATQLVEVSEQNKLQFVTTCLLDEGLQWWDLLKLQLIFRDTCFSFRKNF